ncbi:MAG: low molecular weight phosphotyrosine protein phosphatase, partial [Proteobacteria bacterium]|nr:low molecular weight phosphotyrosine protein phosphatase [Pseudomonadota bacterium]
FVHFDLILAMDHRNFDDIQALYQTAQTEFGAQPLRAKVALMSEHDAQYPQQALPDPYYGGFDGFERVLDQCESSSQAWISIFKQQFEQ